MEVKSDHLNWKDMPSLQTKKVHLNSKDNLPWILVRTPKSMEDTIACFQATVDLTSEKNKNLNSAQKELLKWHQCLGHTSFNQIQCLARSGKLPLKNAKAVGDCTILCVHLVSLPNRRRGLPRTPQKPTGLTRNS